MCTLIKCSHRWTVHSIAVPSFSESPVCEEHGPLCTISGEYSTKALPCIGEGLEQAQMNKLDDLIAQAGICATDHVLDIGFGWGSGAIRAVQTTGCR